jgi:hypothetical protein
MEGIFMPHRTYEYIPGKVLYHDLYGEVSLAELKQSMAELMVFMDQSDRPLHLISDMRRIESYPNNIRELSKTLLVFSHPRMGWEILISNSPAARFIGSSVVQISSSQVGRAARFKAFATADEVMVFLKRLDPSLTELPPLPGDSSHSS